MMIKETVSTLQCGISCFISAENPDLFSKAILQIFNSCFAKRYFTNWNT